MSLNLFYDENKIEAGVDEVGRGSLIGRVYAAAVIWPDDPEILTELGPHLQIKDSKKLSAKQRYILSDFIKDNAIDYAIGYKDHEYIDKKNILVASLDAMHDALDNLNVIPDTILVDGTNFKPYTPKGEEGFIHYICLPKGDNKYISIAAASIIAKVARDEYIDEICAEYPILEEYGMPSNRGYGSAQHMEAIKERGITQFHRKSFKCCI